MSPFDCVEFGQIRSGGRRRCYGAAVEEALAPSIEQHANATGPSAPRLRELLSQLDADGHETGALREELEWLLEALGMELPAFSWLRPPPLRADQLGTSRERQD
jgi:hypothetical protein